MKSVFDQNSNEKFMNDINSFSTSKDNNKYYNYNYNDYYFYKNKEDINKTPVDFFNIQKNKNKLEKMLQFIPRHEKEKKKYKIDNNYLDEMKFDNGKRSKILDFNKNTYNINNAKSNNNIYRFNNYNQSNNNQQIFEEMDGVMPPNFL